MNITPEKVQEDLKFITKQFNKNDKLAWARKKTKMDELIEQLKPFEEKMLALIQERQPIMDNIAELRRLMINDCVHPPEFLVHKETFVHCKFCDAKLVINRYKYFVDDNGSK